jgi:hypothetical protein
MTKYKQCALKCDGIHTVGWIEERGAKEGNLVMIDRELWRVMSVGTATLSKNQVDAMGRAKMPSIN